MLIFFKKNYQHRKLFDNLNLFDNTNLICQDKAVKIKRLQTPRCALQPLCCVASLLTPVAVMDGGGFLGFDLDYHFFHRCGCLSYGPVFLCKCWIHVLFSF